jgi:small lipoprotein (TIGR04452 family)
MYLPSDKENNLTGGEVKRRLYREVVEIDRKYYTNGLNKTLPTKSSHNYNYANPWLLHREWLNLSIELNPKKLYNKDSVDDCISKIRSFYGIILGGIPSIITCDIREVGFLEIGDATTGGKKANKNELLLNILALP